LSFHQPGQKKKTCEVIQDKQGSCPKQFPAMTLEELVRRLIIEIQRTKSWENNDGRESADIGENSSTPHLTNTCPFTKSGDIHVQARVPPGGLNA